MDYSKKDLEQYRGSCNDLIDWTIDNPDTCPANQQEKILAILSSVEALTERLQNYMGTTHTE